MSGLTSSSPVACAPVICLRGPTAAGKTEMAIALAERFPVDIISVDSAMIYRGMDVGTAKPGPGILKRYPHRLIDLLDPSESYSASRFRDDALAEIRRSHRAGRIPLLVGGTLLYFRALEEGLSSLPPANAEVRRQLENQALASGWRELHERLAERDPEAAARIHPNDSQRIQRALEVCMLSGRRMTDLLRERSGPPGGLRFLRLALLPPGRAELHRRIGERFHGMLELGLEEEVHRLRERSDLRLNLPAMRAVGYRQVWLYMDGAYGREEMVRRAIAATRQYAKRQLTWLRRDPAVRTFATDTGSTLGEIEGLVAAEWEAWSGAGKRSVT